MCHTELVQRLLKQDLYQLRPTCRCGSFSVLAIGFLVGMSRLESEEGLDKAWSTLMRGMAITASQPFALLSLACEDDPELRKEFIVLCLSNRRDVVMFLKV